MAAVVAGWALARYPMLLPGLTVSQAAAPHDTLVAVVVAVLAGGAILFPALALLFGLPAARPAGWPWRQRRRGGRSRPRRGGGRAGDPAPRSTPLQARLAVALLIVGVGFLNAADAGWAHAIGVVALFGFMIIAFAAIVPRAIAEDPDEVTPPAGGSV